MLVAGCRCLVLILDAGYLFLLHAIDSALNSYLAWFLVAEIVVLLLFGELCKC